MTNRSWLEFGMAIVLAEGAGLLGSVFSFSAIPTWYATLVRPAIAPPNWVFGPVWTTLFAMMGIAACLVWQQRKRRKDARRALFLFALQFVLNVLWSAIFFGMQNIGMAFGEVLLLWVAIAATIFAFAKISRPAAWLMVPYLLWVSFAAVLNYTFWMTNG